jgi:hypothetical protein
VTSSVSRSAEQAATSSNSLLKLGTFNSWQRRIGSLSQAVGRDSNESLQLLVNGGVP